MNRRIWIRVAAPAPLALAGHRAVFAQSTGPAVRVRDAVGDPFAQGYYAVDGGSSKRLA